MTDEEYAAARLRALVADHLRFEREQAKRPEPDRTVRVGDDRTPEERAEIYRLTHDDLDTELTAEVRRILNL